MEDVRKKLGIIIESPYWDESFEKAIGEPAVPEWLTKGYLFELEEECGVLPKDSNIISFQEKYHSFPSKDSAKDAFLYVFGIKDTPVDEICLEDLPETIP